MTLLRAVPLLLLVALSPQDSKTQPKYTYDAFKSWNAFKEGSSVEFEMEVSGSKMTSTKTLDSKKADVIHLKTTLKMAAVADPISSAEDVTRTVAAADCVICGKPTKDHPDLGTWSDGTMTIDGKEMKVLNCQTSGKNCKGEEVPTFEIRYCLEIPGHFVYMKSDTFLLTCTKFVAKPEIQEEPSSLESPAALKFTYDAFKAWNAFDKGASVELELKTSGTVMTVTKTSSAKEADVIHLTTSTTLKNLADPMAGAEDVKKSAAAPVEGDCALCGKPFKGHKDESRWSEKKMKVGEKELACHVWESPAKLCDGKENANKMEIWYSEEVPGHIVLLKAESVTITCTKFDSKRAAAKAQAYLHDPFKAWNGFAVGSSVEFEMDASGTKMTLTKTIDTKEAGVIHLKTVTRMATLPDPMEGTEDAKPNDPAGPQGDCPLCGKALQGHKDESKWSEKKLKIGEKEVSCHAWEPAEKNCKGEASLKMEIWYSEEVPGHFVYLKMEGITMTCTKFTAKKEKK